jgi:hypothetical protein
VRLADTIEDPKGVVYGLLSEPTKEFIRYSRHAHNKKKNHLFKKIVSNDRSKTTKYMLMWQAATYSDKLEKEDAQLFADETEWERATDDKIFDWIRELFTHIT